jgi:hypothetical protein
MKVKELIKQLSECDPEATIRVKGHPVWFCEQKPPYWDGYAAHVSNNCQKWTYINDQDKVDLIMWDELTFFDYAFRPNESFDDFLERCLDFERIPSHSVYRYVKNWQDSWEEFRNIFEKYHKGEIKK